jgi:predicted MFS family arabinose efflux permease
MTRTNGKMTVIGWQIGIVFCSASMFILVSTIPMFVGALVKHYGLSASGAALLLGGELGIMALSAGLLARKIGSIDRRIVAAAGLILNIVANLSMFYIDSLPLILVARALAGAGCGLAYACGYSSLSNLTKPSLAMMLIGVVVVISTIIMFGVEIPLTAYLGRAAPFGMLIVVALVTLMTTPLLPRSANADLIDDDALEMTASQHMPLLISYVFCIVSMSLVVTFGERIGVNLNLPAEQINYGLAGGAITSVLGSGLIVLLGDRFTYRQYILVAIIASATGSMLLVLGNSLTHFILGVAATAFAAASGQLAYNDLGARSDRTGRMSAIMSSLTAISFSLCPLIGGAAVGLGGFVAVMITSIVMLAVALVLLYSRPAVAL